VPHWLLAVQAFWQAPCVPPVQVPPVPQLLAA